MTTKSGALAVIDAPAQMQTQAVPTPLGMIQLALQQNASVEVLRDLFKLKQEVDADEARKAFQEAFSAFKSESVRIVKNIAVTAGPLNGKKYADLFAVVDAVTPVLSRHGLSSSWKITKDDMQWIEVTCTVRHALGHSESVSMGGPPDAGGAKNAIQARASTVTYLQRYTLLSAVGMAAAGTDNDGNGAPGLPEYVVTERLDWIDGCTSVAELRKVFDSSFKLAQEAKDKRSMDAFIAAKDKKKAELQ